MDYELIGFGLIGVGIFGLYKVLFPTRCPYCESRNNSQRSSSRPVNRWEEITRSDKHTDKNYRTTGYTERKEQVLVARTEVTVWYVCDECQQEFGHTTSVL